jgi:TolC family type I secretion outer membrane protein
MNGRGRIGYVCIVVVAVTLGAAAPATGQEIRAVRLDEALELALEANPAMVQARGQVSIAEAGKRQAIGNWLPSLSANSGYSTNSTERFDERTQTFISGANSSYSAGLSASIQLFDGFSRLAENRAANADLASADAALVNQEFQVVLQTKQAFFNALAANELVGVAERSIERAAEQLRISKDKLAAGTAIRSDTLRGQVELGNARLQLLNAQTQRATAEAELARLMGFDESVRPIPDESLFTPAALDTAQLRVEAVSQSPSVVQADAEVEAAGASVAVARAQYFPTVSASYSRSWSGQEISGLNDSWSARVSLSWPIFNGFARESNVTRSRASRDAARAQAEDARRQASAQFTQYLASLMSAEQSLAIAEASRAAADEELRVVQERYRLGMATIIDVLASQISLEQAEVDIVRSRLDYLVAKAQIEALIGREL